MTPEPETSKTPTSTRATRASSRMKQRNKKTPEPEASMSKKTPTTRASSRVKQRKKNTPEPEASTSKKTMATRASSRVKQQASTSKTPTTASSRVKQRNKKVKAHSDKNLLVVPFTRSNMIQQRAFSYVGPKLWNDLALSLRSISNYPQFKNQLKKFLFDSYFNN